MKRFTLLCAALAFACGSKETSAPSTNEGKADRWGGAGGAPPSPPRQLPNRDGDKRGEKLKEVMDERRFAADAPSPVVAAAPAPPEEPAAERSGEGQSPEAPSRSWFPETFLFQPLVVTGDDGKATVDVRVPDRLTTWRVLALAHSRSGAQGGATTSFLGTLPAYVDPVTPPFLMVGDEIRLPLQAVNTTETALDAVLELDVAGATLDGGAGPIKVPAQGSVVTWTTLKAAAPGEIKLRVSLGGTDAVIKSFPVLPTGKPVTRTVSGTLAAPRELDLVGPEGSDPATDRVRLLVYPGALALLKNQLGVALHRGSVADDAYALLLAGRAPALLGALNVTPDTEALRTLQIVLGQRAVRHARTLDVERATLLTEAALAHPDNPLLARLGERAAAWLAANQRPDGTFGGASGWTLQRLLVTTAEALRAIDASPNQQRATAARLRAAGAFERNLARVDDGYTAAAILAAGGVSGESAAKLRAKVLAALVTREDGAKVLPVARGVVRADGQVPGEAEATALAVLALADSKDPALADLGGALLGGYTSARGWGDGRANLVAMRAVMLLFKDPIPAGVRITLTMDGKEITTGELDAEKLKQVLALEAAAPGSAGRHTWALTAEPAVPGLGYSLTLHSWVPWGAQVARGGMEELALPATLAAEVGRPIELVLRAAAPSGIGFTIVLSLPAGVQPDRASFDALVAAGTLSGYEVADGKVELTVPALSAGQTFAAKVRLIATLGGKLHSSASTLRVGGEEVHAPPIVWSVK